MFHIVYFCCDDFTTICRLSFVCLSTFNAAMNFVNNFIGLCGLGFDMSMSQQRI